MVYYNLEVYKRAYRLALEVHKASLKYPKYEQYELASQLRRSTKSIPVNIAEGMGRQSSIAEVRHYVKMAIGSCDEVRVWLSFSKDLGYLTEVEYMHFNKAYQEIGRMLRGIEKRYSAKLRARI